jgi:hypothetical protein
LHFLITSRIFHSKKIRRLVNIINFDRFFKKSCKNEVKVNNGFWWYPDSLLPTFENISNTYFIKFKQGRKLAESLVHSRGTVSLLQGYYFRFAVIHFSEAGFLVKSGFKNADNEVSTGVELVNQRISFAKNGFVLSQRNVSNYGHFITEVLPSLLAWEHLFDENTVIIVSESTFAESFFRLMGYKGSIKQVKAPSYVFAYNITVLRLLPAGIYYPHLLKEIAYRGIRNSSFKCVSKKVVFLSRTQKSTRKLEYESEVIETIKSVFPEVDVFYSGEALVEEQINRMRDAVVVISTFGAQAMNMVWATKMLHFIEISFYGNGRECFSSLAECLGATSHLIQSIACVDNDHYANHYCDLEKLKIILELINNSMYLEYRVEVISH